MLYNYATFTVYLYHAFLERYFFRSMPVRIFYNFKGPTPVTSCRTATTRFPPLRDTFGTKYRPSYFPTFSPCGGTSLFIRILVLV